MTDTSEARPLEPRQLKWSARRKLRKARREGRTGMLAYAVIPSSNRNGYRYLRSVFIREGRRELFVGNVGDRSVRWVDLAPGSHRLSFVVSDAGKEVALIREVALQPRQILVSWCYTTYSLKPLDRHPRPNRWYIGILDGASGEQIIEHDRSATD
ncbi:hypothetical protein QRX50_20155 [Amycolatopsis carbonis]|uniref:Uncharacterized protein n=1 Tax=Amycolatopsis carbonis TaxID=715471 RepID=A0A9Y2MZS3_9PSEU|nr:hypothetical protein [Amycolatopsis sp. 2-15]WIX82913.1 hypothetical protein QRX50_20155 [Amycolatopsis sp. 2-15]